jgi:hypothetical protein
MMPCCSNMMHQQIQEFAKCTAQSLHQCDVLCDRVSLQGLRRSQQCIFPFESRACSCSITAHDH